METKMTRHFIPVLRLAMGGLFIYAGILKAMDPGALLRSVENYQLVPHALALAAAFQLPYLEIMCGLAVAFKRLYKGALGMLVVLMLVFAAALLSAWARGLNIDCGCFGAEGEPGIYGLALARDAGILAGLGWLAWREKTNDRLSPSA